MRGADYFHLIFTFGGGEKKVLILDNGASFRGGILYLSKIIVKEYLDWDTKGDLDRVGQQYTN